MPVDLRLRLVDDNTSNKSIMLGTESIPISMTGKCTYGTALQPDIGDIYRKDACQPNGDTMILTIKLNIDGVDQATFRSGNNGDGPMLDTAFTIPACPSLLKKVSLFEKPDGTIVDDKIKVKLDNTQFSSCTVRDPHYVVKFQVKNKTDQYYSTVQYDPKIKHEPGAMDFAFVALLINVLAGVGAIALAWLTAMLVKKASARSH